MSLHATTILFRRRLHMSRLCQMALLVLFWLAGEALTRTIQLPVPGGVLGLGLMLALLFSGRLSVASTRRGAQFFLGELLLFFVPAVLAVTDHPELMGWVGLKIAAVILVGTVMVMAVTALVVEFCCRWSMGHVRHRMA
jgi:holin-like protein